MAKVKGAIVVDIEMCKGCVLCVGACPFDVIGMSKQVNGKGYHFAEMVKAEACTGCTSCALVCPDTVITVYRLRPSKK